MPKFVHITSENNSDKIKKNGIKKGKEWKGLFCTPLTSNFYNSHQWMRELKRNGARTMVAVYFNLNSDELIWFGKYNEQHKHDSVTNAVRLYNSAEDKLGYEFFIEREIDPKDIFRIKILPQNIGWRYKPNSHKEKLGCGCPICIPKGGIKSKIKREKFEPTPEKIDFNEVIELLKIETDPYEIENLLWKLKKKKRRKDPRILEFLFEKNNADVLECLAINIVAFKHPNTIQMLLELCKYDDGKIKEYSVESIYEINPQNFEQILINFKDDITIQRTIEKIKNR